LYTCFEISQLGKDVTLTANVHYLQNIFTCRIYSEYIIQSCKGLRILKVDAKMLINPTKYAINEMQEEFETFRLDEKRKDVTRITGKISSIHLQWLCSRVSQRERNKNSSLQEFDRKKIEAAS
uniref:Uncharacterized protein n=1 Tax=Romanomermis culicivorax TaxID=13658 RepID=A0A915KT41_ROMCU